MTAMHCAVHIEAGDIPNAFGTDAPLCNWSASGEHLSLRVVGGDSSVWLEGTPAEITEFLKQAIAAVAGATARRSLVSVHA